MDQNLPQQDLQTKIFTWFAKNSRLFIRLFHFGYYLGLVVLALLAYLEMQDKYYSMVYGLGKNLGQAALLLLGVVVLPGILGRFKIEIRLTRIITLFRRQIGITVFLLALSHYLLIRFVPILIGNVKFQIISPVLFENFGALALFILFFMFVTSNDNSRKKLGRWWTVLHRFVYVAVWLLVLHTGLQKVSVWTLGIFVVGLLEVISWVYYFLRNKGELNKTTGGTAGGGNSSPSQN